MNSPCNFKSIEKKFTSQIWTIASRAQWHCHRTFPYIKKYIHLPLEKKKWEKEEIESKVEVTPRLWRKAPEDEIKNDLWIMHKQMNTPIFCLAIFNAHGDVAINLRGKTPLGASELLLVIDSVHLWMQTKCLLNGFKKQRRRANVDTWLWTARSKRSVRREWKRFELQEKSGFLDGAR